MPFEGDQSTKSVRFPLAPFVRVTTSEEETRRLQTLARKSPGEMDNAEDDPEENDSEGSTKSLEGLSTELAMACFPTLSLDDLKSLRAVSRSFRNLVNAYAQNRSALFANYHTGNPGSVTLTPADEERCYQIATNMLYFDPVSDTLIPYSAITEERIRNSFEAEHFILSRTGTPFEKFLSKNFFVKGKLLSLLQSGGMNYVCKNDPGANRTSALPHVLSGYKAYGLDCDPLDLKKVFQRVHQMTVKDRFYTYVRFKPYGMGDLTHRRHILMTLEELEDRDNWGALQDAFEQNPEHTLVVDVNREELSMGRQDLPSFVKHLAFTNSTVNLREIDGRFLAGCNWLKSLDISALTGVRRINPGFLSHCAGLESFFSDLEGLIFAQQTFNYCSLLKYGGRFDLYKYFKKTPPFVRVDFKSKMGARINLYSDMGWSDTCQSEDGTFYRKVGEKGGAHSPISFAIPEGGLSAEDQMSLVIRHRGEGTVRVRFLVDGAYVELGNLTPSNGFTAQAFPLPYTINEGETGYVSFIGKRDIASIEIGFCPVRQSLSEFSTRGRALLSIDFEKEALRVGGFLRYIIRDRNSRIPFIVPNAGLNNNDKLVVLHRGGEGSVYLSLPIESNKHLGNFGSSDNFTETVFNLPLLSPVKGGSECYVDFTGRETYISSIKIFR